MSISEHLPQTPRDRLILVAAVVVALIVGIVMMRSPSTPAVAAAPSSAMTVTAKPLATVELSRGVIANGTIHAWQEIIIGPEVGGYRVAEVNVDVGDQVKRGAVLLRLSDTMLAAEVASKRAGVQQAQATLENAAAALRRAQSLSTSGVLSQSDLDQLRSEEIAARARVAVANADLEASELRLRHTRITAPDDGVISARMVAVGQIAQVGGEMLRMVRKGRVEWRAEIPEARLREVHIGQVVRLTTADGTKLDGKVRTVSPTVDSSTRAGLVYVDIESAAARPGMFAHGEILLERTTAQMASIVSLVMQDGYSYVFIVNDKQIVERRRVQTGAQKDKLIEITEGVQPDERIVDKGAGFLKDGDRVTVVPDETDLSASS